MRTVDTIRCCHKNKDERVIIHVFLYHQFIFPMCYCCLTLLHASHEHTTTFSILHSVNTALWRDWIIIIIYTFVMQSIYHLRSVSIQQQLSRGKKKTENLEYVWQLHFCLLFGVGGTTLSYILFHNNYNKVVYKLFCHQSCLVRNVRCIFVILGASRHLPQHVRTHYYVNSLLYCIWYEVVVSRKAK